MLNFDPHITGLRRKAIETLIRKRARLQKTADELANTPASYGITGSVNVTNRDVADVKAQIADIDLQIRSLLCGDPSGMSLTYPDYRWRSWL